MAAGPGKQVIWNAAADYPGRYFASVVAKVIASDGPVSASEMVLVPAGTFTMGSTNPDETPVHSVYLDAFYIDKYEVTNAQFEQFINAGGYNTSAFWSADGWAWRIASFATQPGSWGDDGYRSGHNWPGFPVTWVSYYEAEAYAAFAGRRLPTEAEWEKAARGDDGRTYPWGEGIDESRANYNNSGDPYENSNTGVAPVGFYDGRLNLNPYFQTVNSPSAYGAYDMAGNVWEWVADWFGAYGGGPWINPRGPVAGVFKVRRGGGWNEVPSSMRCAYRVGGGLPSIRAPYMGFRCARTGP